MPGLQITTGLIGLGMALFIVLLLRRDHLYILHGLFWLTVASLAALFGLWPGLIDRVAGWAGIVYPPALLLLVAVVVLFVKALYADMANTRLERELRRLNQRVAMMDISRVESTSGIASNPPQATDGGPTRELS